MVDRFDTAPFLELWKTPAQREDDRRRKEEEEYLNSLLNLAKSVLHREGYPTPFRVSDLAGMMLELSEDPALTHDGLVAWVQMQPMSRTDE